jgi:signal transduction histidine kinase
MCKKYKVYKTLIFAYSTYGEVHSDLENYDSALVYLNLALSVSSKYGISTKISDGFCNYEIALCYWQLNENQKALTYATKAYGILKEHGFLYYQKDVAGILSKIWRSKNQLDSALHYQSESLILKDSLWTIEKNVKLNRTILKHKESELLEQKALSEKRLLILLSSSSIGLLLLSLVFMLVFSTRKSAKQNKIIKSNNKLLTAQTEELKHLHEVKDKLFSVVVHDFKTPIPSLESLLYLISKEFVSIEEASNLADKMLDDLQETKTMVDNIIIWAKSQMQGFNVKKKVLEADQLLLEIKNYHVQQALQKEITISLEVDKEITFNSDPIILSIILNNLTSNAIKFTKKQGQIQLIAHVKNNSTVIEIKDNGIGLSNKVQVNMFKPSTFSTVGTAKEKGTGIGLLICKELTELLGGTISVNSSKEGTSFVLTLPQAA